MVARSIDYSLVDNATARRLLSEFSSLIESQIYRFHRVDHDELRSVARLALLESYLTFDETRGSSFSHWFRQILKWRLVKAVKVELSFINDISFDTVSDEIRNGKTPEEKYLEHESLQWFREAISNLSPREGLILSSVIQGEPSHEIALTIGISASRVRQTGLNAVEAIATRARLEGLVD